MLKFKLMEFSLSGTLLLSGTSYRSKPLKTVNGYFLRLVWSLGVRIKKSLPLYIHKPCSSNTVFILIPVILVIIIKMEQLRSHFFFYLYCTKWLTGKTCNIYTRTQIYPVIKEKYSPTRHDELKFLFFVLYNALQVKQWKGEHALYICIYRKTIQTQWHEWPQPK